MLELEVAALVLVLVLVVTVFEFVFTVLLLAVAVLVFVMFARAVFVTLVAVFVAVRFKPALGTLTEVTDVLIELTVAVEVLMLLELEEAVMLVDVELVAPDCEDVVALDEEELVPPDALADDDDDDDDDELVPLFGDEELAAPVLEETPPLGDCEAPALDDVVLPLPGSYPTFIPPSQPDRG